MFLFREKGGRTRSTKARVEPSQGKCEKNERRPPFKTTAYRCSQERNECDGGET